MSDDEDAAQDAATCQHLYDAELRSQATVPTPITFITYITVIT